MIRAFLVGVMSVVLMGCAATHKTSMQNSTQNSIKHAPKNAKNPYFAYDVGMVQPLVGIGLTLSMRQGCLVAGSADDYVVLVFPDSTTHWSEQSQTLTVGDIKLKIGDVFSSNLVHEGVYNNNSFYLPLTKTADGLCLNEGRKMIYLGSLFGLGD